MSLVRIAGDPIKFPDGYNGIIEGATSVGVSNIAAFSTAGDYTEFIGRVLIDGAPAGTKTISSAGGKIYLMTGTALTWANAGTNLRIGIQDIDAVNGPPVRGDGTFDVYADWVPGTNTLSTSTWTTFPMSTGTKSIAHGDFISIQANLTAKAGADSVRFQGISSLSLSLGRFPVVITKIGGTVALAGVTIPTCLIEFDDGTLATLEGCQPISSVGIESFQDSTNPDERGLIFQVPFSCKVCGFWFYLQCASNAADFALDLYSTPLGTPASVLGSAVTFLGENHPAASAGVAWYRYILPSGSEVTLSTNTDYCMAVKGTGTGNITTSNPTYNSATYRFAMSGGTNLRKGSRNNSTGSFTADTTIIPIMGILISHLDNGAGGGGGLAWPVSGPG